MRLRCTRRAATDGQRSREQETVCQPVTTSCRLGFDGRGSPCRAWHEPALTVGRPTAPSDADRSRARFINVWPVDRRAAGTPTPAPVARPSAVRSREHATARDGARCRSGRSDGAGSVGDGLGSLIHRASVGVPHTPRSTANRSLRASPSPAQPSFSSPTSRRRDARREEHLVERVPPVISVIGGSRCRRASGNKYDTHGVGTSGSCAPTRSRTWRVGGLGPIFWRDDVVIASRTALLPRLAGRYHRLGNRWHQN